MSSEETEERESPSFNGGPRAGPALTTILCRGADIGEEDKIPAGLKNGTPPPPPPLPGVWMEPVSLWSPHTSV